MKKILTLAILSSLSTAALAQSSTPQSHSDIEVTATVDAGCDLTADNINFGVLMMPLSDQATTSNINLKCSKNTPLVVQIAYGNVGTQTSLGNVTASNAPYPNRYFLYKDGKRITTNNNYDVWCHISLGVVFNDADISQAYGYKGDTPNHTSWIPDNYNACNGYNINTATVSNLKFNSMESVGKLNGLTKGEVIIYYLETPNNSSQIWNNQNKYNISGTGEEQLIPMKANIKRSDNPTHRMTPDTYQSTLSVVLTY